MNMKQTSSPSSGTPPSEEYRTPSVSPTVEDHTPHTTMYFSTEVVHSIPNNMTDSSRLSHAEMLMSLSGH